ncbi:cupin domain-containing protein [Polyangium mundeleinium]|uniref:Cupin domain-containing protein n=1 Tax=Polyangium mundeleinium TaxID=2995306 RepID=A0ABT5F536_9BACT|nr:cupin domain-containing protein [Polyangium mundeleinium]MDC0749198.1 cupin domain-containing protein [Polyangium mundeleinium]
MTRTLLAGLLAFASVLGVVGSVSPSAQADARQQAQAQRAPRAGVTFHANIDALTRQNEAYRRVLFTAKRMQVVAMSIPPGGEVGQEQHKRVEQVLVLVEGEGKVVLNGVASPFRPGDVVLVTPGVRHNFINTGKTPLKLYTLYAPPNHIPGRVQQTKADAEADLADEAFGQQVR